MVQMSHLFNIIYLFYLKFSTVITRFIHSSHSKCYRRFIHLARHISSPAKNGIFACAVSQITGSWCVQSTPCGNRQDRWIIDWIALRGCIDKTTIHVIAFLYHTPLFFTYQKRENNMFSMIWVLAWVMLLSTSNISSLETLRLAPSFFFITIIPLLIIWARLYVELCPSNYHLPFHLSTTWIHPKQRSFGAQSVSGTSVAWTTVAPASDWFSLTVHDVFWQAWILTQQMQVVHMDQTLDWHPMSIEDRCVIVRDFRVPVLSFV